MIKTLIFPFSGKVTKTPKPLAADYTTNIGFDHELLKKGQWVIPDVDLLIDIIADIKYPTTNSRDADVINRALEAIGAPAFSNRNYIWSCSNFDTSSGWGVSGNFGYADNYSWRWTNLVVSLALLDVPSNVKSSDGTLLPQGLNLNK